MQSLDRFIDGPLQRPRDVEPLQLDIEHLALEPCAAAHFTRHEDVGEEHHLDEHMPCAFARFAAPTRDVERERTRRVAAGAGERLVRKQRAELVECLHVCDGVGAGRPPDRLLIDADDVFQRLPPFEVLYDPDRLAEMLLGGVLAPQPRFELTEQHIVHERRFPGSRHAGDGGESAERNACVDAGKVVQSRALDVEPPRRGTPCRWHADRFFSGQVLPRQRAGFPHCQRRSLIDELPAGRAAGGPELHHPVGGAHRRGIVLDHDDRVASARKTPQQYQQPVHVRGMQADRWLVEDVQGVDEVRAERVG